MVDDIVETAPEPGLRVIKVVLAVLLGLCAIGLVAVVVFLGGMISAL